MSSGQPSTLAKNECSGDENASLDVWAHEKGQIKNMDIRSKVGAATIVDKMRENWLRWFGPVNRRPTDAPFRKCNYETAHGKMVEGDLGRLGKRL
ncbi:hypothetical protein DVH24_018884 [Malus domestica]|uniref:Uncharacterized protein n=1 Tax=Malus domestica TaxID=3750 RepID=A0A498HKT9_MALDO|nr:hypothetical protein DVH24_018884 [Malus domestica]